MDIYGNKDLLSVLEVAFGKAIPTLLVGPTGSGKNTILRHIAHKHDRNDVIRLSLTGETTVDDLIGHYQIKDHNTVWQDGSVTEAVRNGHVLILDEVNAAQPEVLFALQSLLDDDRSLTLTSHDNSVVKAHPNLRVFATMNPTSGYAGTKSMNKAFLSRFGLVLNVGYITADEERSLMSKRLPKLADNDLRIMLQTAQTARRKLESDELTYPLSTRDLLNWAELHLELKNMAESFKHTIVAKAENDGQDLIRILRDATTESTEHADYISQLTVQIDKLSAELSQGTTSGRSLLREEADKAVAVLEDLRLMARDKEAIKQEVEAEVKSNMTAARKKLIEATDKLVEDSKALENKHKVIFQEGYDKAKKEIYTKLGLPTDNL